MLRRTFITRQEKPTLITFISDVEGCHDYFQKYLSKSRVLSSSKSTSCAQLPQIIFKPEMLDKYDCHFVFGGDAFDKGTGDIRFARQLFSFQDRYPSNVHFILGNRDTNKLKLRSELNLQYRDQFVLPMPYYLNERIHVSYEKFLQQQETNDENSKFIADPKNDSQQVKENVLLLKYLLKHRFGSGELFEFRREELALLGENDDLSPFYNNNKTTSHQHREVESVSDLEVLNSFITMSSPGGIYHEFVKRGKLALHIPKTDCVFVHGAINDDSFGLVPTFDLQELPYAASPPSPTAKVSEEKLTNQTAPPPHARVTSVNVHENPNRPPLSFFKSIKPDRDTGILSVDEWFDELEKFKMASLKEWEECGDKFDSSKPNNRRGGASFFAYGHGRCVGSGTSIEVSTYVNDGQPQHIGMKTAVALNLNGITRVAVGHQPIGDTPLVISQPGLTTVMGDISYGDKLHHRPPNGRGDAVAEVLFYAPTEDRDEKTIIHGRTAQGIEYEFENNTHFEDNSVASEMSSIRSSASASACFLGKRSNDGWWSIGKSSENGKVLARKTSDAFRSFETEWLEMEEAMKRFMSARSNSFENDQQQEEQPDITTAVGSKKVLDSFPSGFGQFFHPEYEARESLHPTSIPQHVEKDILRNEKTSSFGKAKVSPKK